jgi:hypothetical protein
MGFLNALKKIIFHESSNIEKEKEKVIENIKSFYGFLERDYGYEFNLYKEFDKFGPLYYFATYTNPRINRHIEWIVKRQSEYIFFYFKRLINGQVPDYKDNENCFQFFEIDRLNGIWDSSRYAPYVRDVTDVLKIGVETLKNNLTVVKGDEWFSRKKLDEITEKKQGKKSGWQESPDILALKKQFQFLIDEYGFEITFDADGLRPFEQGLSASLVYQNIDKKMGLHFFIDHPDRLFSLYKFNPDKYNPHKLKQKDILCMEEMNDKGIIKAKDALLDFFNS